MKTFALCILFVVAAGSVTFAISQETPHPRHHPLRGQKTCERNFIALNEAEEITTGPVYEEVFAVARLYGRENVVPHLYVMSSNGGNNPGEYMPGSVFDKDGRGEIFISRATLADFTAADAPSGAFEGLLARQMSLLMVDLNSDGKLSCDNSNMEGPLLEQQEDADTDAAIRTHGKPVIAFLTRLKSLIESRGGGPPGTDLEMNDRIQAVKNLAPPPPPTAPQ